MSDVTSHGAEFDRDRVYPVLPLRDIVVFPGMIVPLFVGREKSVAALETALAADKSIFLVAQLDPAARSLLHLFCCLAAEPAAIPLALFEHRGDWTNLRSALQVLEARAFVTCNEDERLVFLHRTVREILRDRLSPEELASAKRKLARASGKGDVLWNHERRTG